MKNISIIGKLISILVAFGLFALGVVTYSATQIWKIDTDYGALLSGEMLAAQQLARGSETFQTARAAIAEMTISRKDVDNKNAVASLRTATEEMIKSFDAATKALPRERAVAAMRAQALKVLAEDCKPAVDLAMVAVDDTAIKASQDAFLSNCQPLFPLLTAQIGAVTQAITKHANDSRDVLSREANSTVISTFSVVIGGLIVVLACAFFAIRTWIVSPVKMLAEAMRRLAGGDYETDVKGSDRRDEIGQMAKAVLVFKTNGLEAQALAAESEKLRSQSEITRQKMADTDRVRADAMATATSSLGEGLQHLAAGDLTFQVNQPFAVDFEKLRDDFNAAVVQLSQTLQSVAVATAAIDNGSREISSSADNLSKRTEQQAAALEETAAALDQITANVANSSKRADEARKVAVQANESAAQSGRVVASAVDAMRKIEQSSNQVSNIIGVIDEIAFQTNLLALNAGVEAARAGEAGKGFAVVAQEVRELAQRSAQAAREIKELIRSSSVEVQSGVKLVSETGEALQTIENYIVMVNQHMDAIATSAREQSLGLAEVNTAVNQMDQVTQQNAAMVEETSAAGATLASESGRLHELISQFRLNGAPGNTELQIASEPAYGKFSSPANRLTASVSTAFSGNAAIDRTWRDR